MFAKYYRVIMECYRTSFYCQITTLKKYNVSRLLSITQLRKSISSVIAYFIYPIKFLLFQTFFRDVSDAEGSICCDFKVLLRKKRSCSAMTLSHEKSIVILN